jgi:hypothetical protein
MINLRQLEIMYQQWLQENDRYIERWIDFVEMAARDNATTADQIMKELQKCYWFRKGE